MSNKATARLTKEFAEAAASPLEGITLNISKNNLYVWETYIKGPEGTPYEGGCFEFEFKFSAEYPFVAPKVKCLTKIFHANFNSIGDVCLNILKEDWKPIYTAQKILLAIQDLLSDPNPDSPLMPSVGELLRNNKNEYERRARLWTRKFAMKK